MLLEVGLAGGESPDRGPHFHIGWQQPQRLRLGGVSVNDAEIQRRRQCSHVPVALFSSV